ncbi:ROK family transcriptional regulator [Nocardioides sp. GY 10127]|uniref:ROK family transcriptional regulator n=1 Tax=Nocardioides sp. GY 10127 TaxID=2569762 RepID=UPI0010A7FF29|nr:ROK family transcriptional regulator [Nocardioides sp. GY 10127]TIC84331.1 ROK family transcriptional regulator [Nocardioides sp. GY 10127]
MSTGPLPAVTAGTAGTAATAGTDALRRASTAAVLRALRAEGPGSRAELARRTGLAKATVGAVVADLVQGEVVVEAAAPASGRGRPSVTVSPGPRGPVGLGLELNVDYVAAVVVDLAGRVTHAETRPVDTAPAGADGLETLLDLVGVVGADLAARGVPVVGAVLALPGLVAADGRTPTWVPHVPVPAEGPADAVEARLAALLGPCRVVLENDANCAAWAEYRHGAARGSRDVLYLTGTVGIGAGLLADGRLLRGGHGLAGEAGHVPLGVPGERCRCGQTGCWETGIGLRAMLAAVGVEATTGATPVEVAAAVVRRAETDATVVEGLRVVGHRLGTGLAALTSLLDPSLVVLGGYFGVLGELLLGPAREALEAGMPGAGSSGDAVPVVLPRPRLVPGELGITGAATGAAERALDGVLSGAEGLDAVLGRRAGA